jgi:hypothetical protein
MSQGVNGDYRQALNFNMFSNSNLLGAMPPEIDELTGYDPAMKAQIDRFVPNRFTALLQHIGAGGKLTEAIQTNTQVQVERIATSAKQDTLNAAVRSALAANHFKRLDTFVGLMRT